MLATARVLAVLLAVAAGTTACNSGTKAEAPAATTSPAAAPAVAPDAAAAAAAAANAKATPEGKFFVEKGCAQCHALKAYGVVSQIQMGPDLGLAKEDVKARFGVELEEFFANPPGTMALVLSSQIVLTPEEKKDVIRRLEAAFEAHKKLGGAAAAH
jgi:cytochrome c5